MDLARAKLISYSDIPDIEHDLFRAAIDDLVHWNPEKSSRKTFLYESSARNKIDIVRRLNAKKLHDEGIERFPGRPWTVQDAIERGLREKMGMCQRPVSTSHPLTPTHFGEVFRSPAYRKNPRFYGLFSPPKP